jgi:hypothetical protein
MLNVSAASNVKGPSLPISIVAIIINLPASVNVVKGPVTPVDKPTVPRAEAVSNIISDIIKPFEFSVILRANVAMNKTATKSSVMVIALPTTTIRTDRLNISTSCRFRSAVTAVIKTTANVTVLIPPAVEPGEPPMNISKIKTNLLDADRLDISTVLKPAVLAVTD